VLGAVQIAGYRNACIRRAIGTVSCWTENTMGQLGVGNSSDASSPLDVLGIDDAVQVTVGDFHACARHASGSVSCWGATEHGRLGDGVSIGVGAQSSPVRVVHVNDAVDVAGGRDDTCAVHSDGSVSCWGHGVDESSPAAQPHPVRVPGLDDAVAIANGESKCAIRASGDLACWGDNHLGQLGTGTLDESLYRAVPVIGLR
jgi:alpha-tubulin suppressor-like RCC1 family protein